MNLTLYVTSHAPGLCGCRAVRSLRSAGGGSGQEVAGMPRSVAHPQRHRRLLDANGKDRRLRFGGQIPRTDRSPPGGQRRQLFAVSPLLAGRLQSAQATGNETKVHVHHQPTSVS